MEQERILFPMVALVALTFAVLLLVPYKRGVRGERRSARRHLGPLLSGAAQMRITTIFLSKVLPLFMTLLAQTPAIAQQQPQKAAPGFPDAPGKETLLAKCFQCHTPAMWMDQRQDRRAWESALYRMVGRGALWTEDEIKAMADYLGAVYAKGKK